MTTTSRERTERDLMTELDELADKQRILEVLLRYCRGVDRLDEDLVRSCYHEDARDHHGMVDGHREQFIEYAMQGLSTMSLTQHNLHNVLIELDGDAAVSEAYCVAYHRMPSSMGGEVDHMAGLRYVDRFERRDRGPWLIARRTVAYEWTRIDTIDRQWQLGPEFTRGQRDRDDVLYRELAWLRDGKPDSGRPA